MYDYVMETYSEKVFIIIQNLVSGAPLERIRYKSDPGAAHL